MPPGSGAYRPDVVQWTGKRGRWTPERDARERAEQERCAAVERHEALAERVALYELKSAIAKFRYDLAFERFKRAFFRWLDAALRDRKAGFRPDQPRWPAGSGRWSGGAGTAAAGVDRSPTSASPSLRDIQDTPDNTWRLGAQFAQDERQRRYSVSLREEEGRGGHTVRNHVGKSDDELLATLTQRRFNFFTVSGVGKRLGTFESIETGNDFVNRTLERNKPIVDLVASGTLREEFITARFGYETGREAFRSTPSAEPYIRSTYSVGVLIRHDAAAARGYRVITAHPRND
jgi:hypothetical protein